MEFNLEQEYSLLKSAELVGADKNQFYSWVRTGQIQTIQKGKRALVLGKNLHGVNGFDAYSAAEKKESPEKEAEEMTFREEVVAFFNEQAKEMLEAGDTYGAKRALEIWDRIDDVIAKSEETPE